MEEVDREKSVEELKRKELALKRMELLCSRREYAVVDIVQKLKRRDLDTSEIEWIIESLKRDRFLDENRYAVAYAREKSLFSGWGRTKIEYFLKSKKLEQSAIDSAFDDIDQDRAANRMEEVIRRKWVSLSSLSKDQMAKRREKTLRFGMARGYNYEEVKGIIKRLEQ